jgi:hypothetical protein
MWFLLGIVPLATYLGWRWGPAATPNFEKRARRLGNADWWFSPVADRGRSPAAIGVRAPAGFDFVLRAEAAADRRAQRSGVLTELQVGDPGFDRSVFIESDDPLVARALADDAELRDGLRRLLSESAARTITGQEIRVRGGRVWMRFAFTHGTRPEAQAARVVPVLAAFANRLREQPRGVPLAVRDPFVRRAAWVLGIHLATCVAAIAGVMSLRFATPPLLDPFALVSKGFLAGVLLHVVWMALARRWLGHSARARLVGLELLLVGTLATSVTTAFALREANVWFDPHVGRWDYYLDGDVVRYSRRKSLDQWWIEPGEPAPGSLWRVHLPIDRSTAERLRMISGRSAAEELSYLFSDTVTLAPFRAEIRPGLFGAEWLGDVETLPDSEAARLRGRASPRAAGERKP